MGDSENNMDNTRTTSSRSRANRRARGLRCRGRVRPRRLGLSKVVDVVSNSNDMLGTTIGSKSNGKYSAAVLSAFGESLETQHCEVTSNFKHQTSNSQTFFTGKPFVEGLGHAFWMRNYRAGSQATPEALSAADKTALGVSPGGGHMSLKLAAFSSDPFELGRWL